MKQAAAEPQKGMMSMTTTPQQPPAGENGIRYQYPSIGYLESISGKLARVAPGDSERATALLVANSLVSETRFAYPKEAAHNIRLLADILLGIETKSKEK